MFYLIHLQLFMSQKSSYFGIFHKKNNDLSFFSRSMTKKLAKYGYDNQ